MKENSNDNKFVRVPNDWFQEDVENKQRNFVCKLGVNPFVMWFELNKVSAQMNMSKIIQAQIKQITIEMEGIQGFAKAESVRNHLLKLKKLGLIKCKLLNEKTLPSTLLNIELIEQDHTNGFSPISCELYNDKILKIQPRGFLVYCLLYKNHNINFGGTTGYGHAEINRDSICRYTGINSITTITKTISDLKNAKELIKISQSKIISNENQGEKEVKYLPNCYTVFPKCDIENKYYINFRTLSKH